MHKPAYIAALLITLAVAAVTTSPATAAAAKTPQAKVRALKTKVRALRGDLRAQRADLATAAGQNAALAKTLGTLTIERDRARTDAAALRRQIASTPTQLQRAVRLVSNDVEYSEYVLRNAGVTYSRGALIAHAAMEYVDGHVSATAFGYLNELKGTRPEATAEATLASGAGICGYASLTLAAILKRFNLPTRSVQFYYEDGRNHIAVEVFYDGDWHYYDAYYGTFYENDGEVLSISEARAHPSPGLRHQSNQFWFTVALRANLKVADLSYELSPATRVEIDKQPFSGR
jgi:hypothetical protein